MNHDSTNNAPRQNDSKKSLGRDFTNNAPRQNDSKKSLDRVFSTKTYPRVKGQELYCNNIFFESAQQQRHQLEIYAQRTWLKRKHALPFPMNSQNTGSILHKHVVHRDHRRTTPKLLTTHIFSGTTSSTSRLDFPPTKNLDSHHPTHDKVAHSSVGKRVMGRVPGDCHLN